MSKSRTLVIVILSIIALALIGWNLTDSDSEQQKVVASDAPTYQSQHTETLVYDPTGALQYKLIADNVKYFEAQEDGLFTQPIMTLFDKEATATWTVRSNTAKLTKEKLLYLYGDVKVNSLVPTSQLKTIDTDNALVNLITQDVSSEDEVILGGTGFHSNGFKMRGNLREKHAKLIEKVKTTYEIQNQ